MELNASISNKFKRDLLKGAVGPHAEPKLSGILTNVIDIYVTPSHFLLAVFKLQSLYKANKWSN